MTAKLVVLVSGNGSNLQAILDACATGTLDARVEAVISNRIGAFALDRASQSGVESFVVEPVRGEDRAASDARLARIVARYEPSVVVLAGWLRVLSPAFLDHFKVINLHPALPGEFAGLHAIDRAFAAWQAGDIANSGVMVHWVPDAGVDSGPVIASQVVAFEDGDTLDVFEERMHAAEHELIVSALGQIFQESAS